MLTLLLISLLSAWAATPSLTVNTVHGQNCSATARWYGPNLEFSDFISPAADQARTACQVVTTASVPEGYRATLKLHQLRGISAGEGSIFHVSVTSLPPKGKSAEIKFAESREGRFISGPAAQKIVGRCGADFKFLTKAAAFFHGKPRPQSLSINQVVFQIALEPCQGH